MEKIFIFTGPPGSGKGSLSNLCAKKFDWRQLSTGNLCRKHVADRTKIGQNIDFAIKSGRLVSNELITQMVIDWFASRETSDFTVILDGYPRTTEQAESFSDYIEKNLKTSMVYVVKFFISDDTVVERLGGRYVCQNDSCQAVYSSILDSLLAPKQPRVCNFCTSGLGRRKDDEVRTIQNRLRIYHTYEDQLLNFYYGKNWVVKKINADRPLNEVFDSFEKLIKAKIYN